MGITAGKPTLTDEEIQSLVESSGMEAEKVEEYFRQFLIDNKDGKMDKKEFTKYLHHAYPKKDIAKIANHIFNVFDKDDNGKIEFAEFAVVYHTMKGRSGKAKLKEIFRVFDANSDGFITSQEMRRLIKDMYAILKHDDPAVAAEKMIADSAFSEMDADGDGKITEQEFLNAVNDEAEFTTLLAAEIDHLMM